MRATPSDLRVLTLTKIDRCAWNEHEIDEDGRCVPCNAPVCDCGLALDHTGRCLACDVCHCAAVDRETGYTRCEVHAYAPHATGDLMAALKTAMCRCTSDEFARPACAVHGKAV